jgi:ATP-dependent DNA helicase RecQ
MDLLAELKLHFGFGSFRPGQLAVIQAVLAGQDALAVHPTGAGKSLMYQLPAVARRPADQTRRGVVLVVSPLIALMQDQVDSLRRRSISAAFVNSTLSAGERQAVWQGVADDEIRLLYCAPEQFETAGFADRLTQAGCWLLVVDEAHCISQWGHDFRPDYAHIGRLLGRLSPRPNVLAVTATATSRVRKEIAELLTLREPLISLHGIYRPNLRITVQTDAGHQDRLEALLRVAAWAVSGRSGSMIVYAGSRDRTETLAMTLSASGYRAAAYHAGMNAMQRAARQDRFNTGETPIIVATNAFGMGIDKPDIRAVVHWRLPESLEAYYQEIGRAGRDGQQSLCLGFLGPGDVNQLEYMIRNNNPFPSQVEAEFRSLRSLTGGRGGRISWPYTDLPRSEAQGRRIVCNFLARFGALHMDRDQVELDPDWPGLTPAQRRWMDQKRQMDMDRLGQVSNFAREARCRMLGLQEYFGFADLRAPCGHCDICQPIKAAPAEKKKTRGRGDAETRRQKQKAAAIPSTAASPPTTVDDLVDQAEMDLFEKLRTWRTERAAGKPAYTVCSDRTLIDLVRRRPTTMDELAEIHGIGPARLKAFGRGLLDLLNKQKR